MLVLTRNTGQSINIGNDIKITVAQVSGEQVRIGIDAPRDIDVHREEIYLKIQDNQDGIFSTENIKM